MVTVLGTCKVSAAAAKVGAAAETRRKLHHFCAFHFISYKWKPAIIYIEYLNICN